MKREWRIHPNLDLDDILASTYGLPVYQEQIMAILAKVAGWSYAEAGLLFDALRKKQTAKMEASKPGFFEAAKVKGHSQETLDALWEALLPWSDYGFNLSHSAGYGLVSYWTSFLKANHPIQYMTALLSSVAEDKDRLPEYLAEVSRMGIRLLPPDINHSGLGFTAGKDGIHYGIGAIRGVGEAVYTALAPKRPFSDLDDFFRRAPAKALNSGSLGALIASGTLDGLTPYREELWIARETLSARATRDRAERRAGQKPLYRIAYGVGNSNLRSVEQRQTWERQYLSTVLTRDRVELVPTRALSENELIWLRTLISKNPGDCELSLRIGRSIVNLPSANWPAVKQAVKAFGVFQ